MVNALLVRVGADRGIGGGFWNGLPVQPLDFGLRAPVVGIGVHHQTFARRIEREADIAEIRVRDMLQFGESPSGKNANHGPPRVELTKERFDFVGLARGTEPDVERGENSALHGEQVR